jgi:hypothetical protein
VRLLAISKVVRTPGIAIGTSELSRAWGVAIGERRLDVLCVGQCGDRRWQRDIAQRNDDIATKQSVQCDAMASHPSQVKGLRA